MSWFFKKNFLFKITFTLSLHVLASCSNNTKISHSVVIDASLKEVWAYNGNDKNAKEWSIFFAKIVPCPTSECPENKFLQPGEVGSTRRCYRNENEKGVYWDEITLESNLSAQRAYRKIITHNIQGYGLKSLEDKAEYLVEQEYKSLNSEQTELSFSVSLQKYSKLRVNADSVSSNDTDFLDRLVINTSFSLGASRTHEIFVKNLENIKSAIEQKDRYTRKHAYSKFCNFKDFWCSTQLSDF